MYIVDYAMFVFRVRRPQAVRTNYTLEKLGVQVYGTSPEIKPAKQESPKTFKELLKEGWK
jgi:hypothetical protein